MSLEDWLKEKKDRIYYLIDDWKYPIFITFFLFILYLKLTDEGVDNEQIIQLYAVIISIGGVLTFSMASPTISLEIQSGINYYLPKILKELKKMKKIPDIDIKELNLDEFKDIIIKDRSYENLVYDTRVFTKNESRFPAKFYINLNLKIGEYPVKVGKLYRNKQPWGFYPHQKLNGHFDQIKKVIGETNEGNRPITMKIKIRNAGIFQYLMRYPTQNWKFILDKNNENYLQWYNTDFGYSV